MWKGNAASLVSLNTILKYTKQKVSNFVDLSVIAGRRSWSWLRLGQAAQEVSIDCASGCFRCSFCRTCGSFWGQELMNGSACIDLPKLQNFNWLKSCWKTPPLTPFQHQHHVCVAAATSCPFYLMTGKTKIDIGLYLYFSLLLHLLSASFL